MFSKSAITIPTAPPTIIFSILAIRSLTSLICSKVCFCIIRHSFSWSSIFCNADFLAIVCNPRYKRNPVEHVYHTAQIFNFIYHVLNLCLITCSSGDSNALSVCVKPVVGLTLLANILAICGSGKKDAAGTTGLGASLLCS